MSEPRENPFAPPGGEPPKPSSRGSSVFDEPHMHIAALPPSPDPVSHEPHVDTPLPSDSDAPSQDDLETIEQSIWSEPGLAHALGQSGKRGGLIYADWLNARMQETSIGFTWLLTLGIVLVAGVFGVLGALFFGPGSLFNQVLSICVFGPLTEEVVKIALVFWVVEKRPYLFSNTLQILLCGFAGGLLFAVIENFIYLNIYIPNPSPEIVQWRWTICVALHTGCSSLAALGMSRIWGQTMVTRSKPDITLGANFLILAVVIHAFYNTLMVLMSVAGYST